MRRAAVVVVIAGAALVACQSASWLLPGADVAGSWGGENASFVAADSTARIQIGCQFGQAAAPIRLRADRTFDATGTFTVGVGPIALTDVHPARFAGVVLGTVMQLTVSLTDTAGVFGPVTLALGAEPRIGMCPL